MATSQMNGVIQCLRMVLQDDAGRNDAKLLEDFISRHDASALTVLVRRHGPMIWGVCRRVLNNYHDAEDAFQATFLVLVRKAGSIASRELLANWLYGVAHQTALKARATAAKRSKRERQVIEMPEPAVIEHDPWRDLQPVLDEELSRLPDKYRGVIVLCDLESKTRKEAARQLGLPEGTVASRLARARVMLARRLKGRGVALSGGALAALLARQAAAGVPCSVVDATIKAASLLAAGKAATGVISLKVAVLTEGAMKAMFLTKLKTAAVGLAVTALCAAGLIFQTQIPERAHGQSGPEQSISDKNGAKRNEHKKPEKASDLDRLQGTWRVVSDSTNPNDGDVENWTIEGRTVRVAIESKKTGTTKAYRRFRLDETATPKRIDFVEGNAGNLFALEAWDTLFDDADLLREGIYSIDDDALTIRVSRKKGHRPGSFTGGIVPISSSDSILLSLRRQKPKNEQMRQPRILEVELAANKDVKEGSLKAVKAAVEKIEGVRANVSFSVQEIEGISARIRASGELPYIRLAQLIEALKNAGVGTITIVTDKDNEPAPKTTGAEDKFAMAWGKEVDGLQAGIRLRAVDVLNAANEWKATQPKGAILQGGILIFEVVVRNASKEEINVKYVQPCGFPCMEDGAELKFAPAYTGGQPILYEKTLKPGENWEVAQLNISTRKPKSTESFSGLVLLEPGKFRVSCPSALMQEKKGKLATGEIEVEIVPPKGENPGEVERGRPEEKTDKKLSK